MEGLFGAAEFRHFAVLRTHVHLPFGAAVFTGLRAEVRGLVVRVDRFPIEAQLFDDARVERPEIMELYELMTPQQQSNLINYARGMLAASAPEEAAAPFKRRA